jgi:hypothetical protein
MDVPNCKKAETDEHFCLATWRAAMKYLCGDQQPSISYFALSTSCKGDYCRIVCMAARDTDDAGLAQVMFSSRDSTDAEIDRMMSNIIEEIRTEYPPIKVRTEPQGL